MTVRLLLVKCNVKYLDPTGIFQGFFGTYIDDEGLSLRGTLVIDPDQVLKTIEINENDIGRSAKRNVPQITSHKFVEKMMVTFALQTGNQAKIHYTLVLI